MIKINNTQKIILIIFTIFLINPVLGNVNITFYSENEKIINIVNIDNGYSQISSNSTNQTIELPYNNYKIKLYATNTKIKNNNGSFILNNLAAINNDWQLLFWIAIIILLIISFLKMFKDRL